MPRRRSGEEKKVVLDHILRAQVVKDGAVLLLLWENLDAMAYVKLGPGISMPEGPSQGVAQR